jgi:hypothetical protein
MDPLTAKAGETALSFAADRAAGLLREARERHAEDAGRCEKFLEAALAAIEGLEREYDEILVEARHVRDDAARAAALERRIDVYLTVDRLRPRLKEAIDGLDFYCTEFRTRSDSYLQWPWRRGDRKRAVEEFARLLSELQEYLKSLDQTGLQYRSAGTGVGIDALFALKQALSAPSAVRAETPDDVATRYQNTRDKEQMFHHITRIRRTIEDLRQTFGH